MTRRTFLGRVTGVLAAVGISWPKRWRSRKPTIDGFPVHEETAISAGNWTACWWNATGGHTKTCSDGVMKEYLNGERVA